MYFLWKSPHFKYDYVLKVDCQMKLLQYSWSDMLVLDHIHHRVHNQLPDDAPLPNGQKFDLLNLALLGVPASIDRFNDVIILIFFLFIRYK